MSLLERIDTICLTVRNAEKASNWYQEVLGLNESFKGDNYRILSVGNSGVPLTIEEGNLNPSDSQFYPIFYSKNIEEVYWKLKEKSIKTSELQNDGVNKFFDLYDLDGNKLQVCYWK
ncbi:VOC family protein [Lederbergia sp. NSJ-179]|uniref:VOC family protein n=1 Tax=Lederbergia sp. NSJ-179 TaxID=2931402 RepID=UPI001FD500C2|nr:VOC family protein [Lederbergia sp. NSJ-179]MCJ7841392.1 VOC family protein [Lederbergia sp. NSJ-179]